MPTGTPDESGTIPSRTEQGTTIGTPAYMSPEQAGGLIDQLGPASDVYSLGASLYELLTGQLAFRDEKIAGDRSRRCSRAISHRRGPSTARFRRRSSRSV